MSEQVGRWRPTVAEERWLAVASRLGAELPQAAVEQRIGGWRVTGAFTRIALFVLGLVAAGLLLALVFLTVGGNPSGSLLLAGIVIVAAGEGLIAAKRLHASGIEEGLCLGGSLVLGAWLISSLSSWNSSGTATFVLGIATAIAGVRLLNPFVTTCAAFALLHSIAATAFAGLLDEFVHRGFVAFVAGCALTALALALGGREYRRPAHDRMLDWLVAALPWLAYLHVAGGRTLGVASGNVGGTASAHWATSALLIALAAALLAAGLRRRRHAPLIGFLGCVAGLAVELRTHVALANETWLLLCGGSALVVGVALERYLRTPRNGLTSVRLHDDRDSAFDLLQTAGSAVLSHRAAPVGTAPAEPAMTQGEGRFGGGGASGRF